MSSRDADEILIESWLGTLTTRLKAKSISAYAGDVRHLSAWLGGSGGTLLAASPDDLARFSLHLEQSGLSARTTHRRRRTISTFYEWLHAGGRLQHNPARQYDSLVPPGRGTISAMSSRDLRHVVAVAEEPLERSLILSFTVLGMGPREIAAADLQHLSREDRPWSLRIPSRPAELPLPHLVEGPLAALIADRHRGPIFRSRAGTPLDRAAQIRVLNRLAKKAKLGYAINGRLLHASTRDLLANNPVPYAALQQGLTSGGAKELFERGKYLPRVKTHATFYAASLIRPDQDSTDALLDVADGLSQDERLPTAVRLLLAGAVFERHLRVLAIAADRLDSNVGQTTITSLAGQLRGAHVLSNEEVQACATVAEARDWAAHGWFELVTDELADRVIGLVQRITRDHPTD